MAGKDRKICKSGNKNDTLVENKVVSTCTQEFHNVVSGQGWKNWHLARDINISCFHNDIVWMNVTTSQKCYKPQH